MDFTLMPSGVALAEAIQKSELDLKQVKRVFARVLTGGVPSTWSADFVKGLFGGAILEAYPARHVVSEQQSLAAQQIGEVFANLWQATAPEGWRFEADANGIIKIADFLSWKMQSARGMGYFFAISRDESWRPLTLAEIEAACESVDGLNDFLKGVRDSRALVVSDLAEPSLSVADIAAATEFSRGYINNEIGAGRLEAVQKGKLYYVAPSEYIRWYEASPNRGKRGS